jgi:hypothetical protein
MPAYFSPPNAGSFSAEQCFSISTQMSTSIYRPAYLVFPESVSPNAEAIKNPILSLAEDLVVSDQFNFGDSTRNKK